jgi:succinate dehydrogenase/fumarate reductase cytochrome b subunit
VDTAVIKSTTRRFRLERVLSFFDRLAAWGSAAVLVLYVVSGFGLTRAKHVASLTGGVLNLRFAFTLHNNLYIPLLVFFGFHTFMGLRRALIRTTRQKSLAGWVAVGAGAVVVTYLAVLGLA